MVSSTTTRIPMLDVALRESTPRLGKITSTAPVLPGCLDPLQATTRFTSPRLSPPPTTRTKSSPNTLASLEAARSPVIAAVPIPTTKPTSRLDARGLPGFPTPRNPPTTTTAMLQPPHRLLGAAETDHQQRAITTRRQTLMTELLAAANDRVFHHLRHARDTQTWTTTTAPRLAAQRL